MNDVTPASTPEGVRTAAVLTVGTEITEGLRADTNSAEVARALAAAGHVVGETASVPDDVDAIAAAIVRLCAAHDTVVVTGGLGPTHDDVTREAAAAATGLALGEDPRVKASLGAVLARHASDEARSRVLRQALVLGGADVIPATTGTAPGQVVRHEGTLLALLPGVPSEMRAMLAGFVGRFELAPRAEPAVLSCAGITESEAQLAAQSALAGEEGVSLTVLARPAEADVILIDRGAGASALAAAASRVREALGDACYAADGETLAAAVLALASGRGASLAVAESCTGGLVAAEITSVPGSSESFLGGIVSYSDDAKRWLLGVTAETLETFGAVSRETAVEMAEGARRAFGAGFAVSVTGVAGPGGGTEERPVGTVWFCVSCGEGRHAVLRSLPGDREGVRRRATSVALDLLRRCLAGSLPLEPPCAEGEPA